MPTSLLSDITGSTFPLATTTTPGAVLARGYGAELPLGTPTFNGGVAPTTPNLLYKSYFWNLIDHQVFLYWQALWSTGVPSHFPLSLHVDRLPILRPDSFTWNSANGATGHSPETIRLYNHH